jgi:putative transposase
VSSKPIRTSVDATIASPAPIKELCRKGGLSDATFYKWRAKYDGMDVPDAKRLRDLEAENNKLKKLLAETHLDIRALNTAFGVKR